MFESMAYEAKLGLLLFLLTIVVTLLILRWTRHNREIRSKIKIPLIFILFLLAVYNTLYIFRQPLPSALEGYFFALLYLSVAVFVIRIATILFFDVFLVQNKKYRVPRLMKEITSVVLFLLTLILILQHTLNFQVTTLLATSALITVVVGLALQETLGNLFAGVALNMDPPYKSGDWIRTGDNTGVVEEITWRATKLRTLDNDFVIIPNGQIAKEKLINLSYPPTPHSTRLEVGVSYRVPPNKMIRVVQEAIKTIDNILQEPAPDIRLVAFQDFSILYQLKLYYRDYAKLERSLAALRKALWYHFRRNGIEIPFPIRNVYLHQQQEKQEEKEHFLRRMADSLGKVDLFGSLTPEERLMMAQRLEELRFAQGEFIIQEGERGESFFIVEDGQVEVFLTSVDGLKQSLNVLAGGDFFGEISLLTGQRRSANVQAITDVRVFRLSKNGFKAVLADKPQILDTIGKELCRRKDQIEHLLAERSQEEGRDQPLNIQEAQSRVLSRLRSYFGL